MEKEMKKIINKLEDNFFLFLHFIASFEWLDWFGSSWLYLNLF